MADQDIAAQWKSFDQDKRTRLLSKMTPEQKTKLRGMLEGKSQGATSSAPPSTVSQPVSLSRLANDTLPPPTGYVDAATRGLADVGQGVFQVAEMIHHPIDTLKAMTEAGPKVMDFLSGSGEHTGQNPVESTTEILKNAAANPAEAGHFVSNQIGQFAATEGLGAAGKLRLSVKDRFQPFARKVTQVEPAVKDAVTKTAEKQVDALADNRVKRTEAAQQGLKTQAAARTDIDRTKMAIGEKNKGIEAENQAQADKVARRGELAKSVDQQSLDLGKHLEKVEASVGKEANQKFDAVRGKLGISEGNPGPEVPPDQLVATVRDIEQNVLQGIPENVKEFRSILGHGEEAEPGMRAEFTQATGKEPLGGLPFTWDKLQSLKSRLDARLRQARGMNGDLKRGLYQARNAVVNTMGEIAEPAGAGETWADAKNFYTQYKEDFHEPTGPSGSGSPVAQALDAVDPKNIRQPFLRTQSAIGNRGTEILRKYPQHGGNEAATHAENLLAGHQEMSGLPEKASPKALKPVPEAFQLPDHKPLPKIPETPEVNINKAAKDAIATRAKNWGAFNARDVGILASSSIGGAIGSLFGGRGTFEGALAGPIAYETGKFAMSRALNNPKIINWLAKTPPEEVAAIQKIPGADKVRIVDVLTRTAMDAAKDGKLPVLSPEVRRLLGPANIARIAAVTGATQPKNPGEARDRVRQFANP